MDKKLSRQGKNRDVKDQYEEEDICKLYTYIEKIADIESYLSSWYIFLTITS